MKTTFNVAENASITNTKRFKIFTSVSLIFFLNETLKTIGTTNYEKLRPEPEMLQKYVTRGMTLGRVGTSNAIQWLSRGVDTTRDTRDGFKKRYLNIQKYRFNNHKLTFLQTTARVQPLNVMLLGVNCLITQLIAA